jgi:predicted oxidoreductase
MFKVTTKILRDNRNRSAHSVSQSIERSLTLLNIDTIKTLYVHGTNLSYQDDEILIVLKDFEKLGLIKKMGWCGALNAEFNPPKDLFQELMVRVNPWDTEIFAREDLIDNYSIVGMNVFANWFWNYQSWSPARSFINAHLFRKFNPAPTYYFSHPMREKLAHVQDFDQLMTFSLSCDFLEQFVIGTTNSSHLTQVIDRCTKFSQT